MVARRMLGALILLIGILGIGMTAVGTLLAHRIVSDFARTLDSSLALSSRTLGTAKQTLLLTKATSVEVIDGLAVVETTLVDVAQVLSDTQPLLDEVVQVTSHDVPETIESLQASLPDVSRAAAMIDETLVTLNDLSLSPRVLGVPLRLEFDLGYEPEVSFEKSIIGIGDSLEGIAPRLRALEPQADALQDGLGAIHQDLEATPGDLGRISTSIAEAGPLLDASVLIVTETQGRIENARMLIPRQVVMTKLAMTAVLVWVGLAQIAPLHYGWCLLTDRRPNT
jgi:hypothetical protein